MGSVSGMKHNTAVSSRVKKKKKIGRVGARGLLCDICIEKEHIYANIPRLISEEKKGIKVPAAKMQNKSKRGKAELDTSAHRKTEKLSEVTKKVGG